MRHFRNDRGELVIERTPEELATIAGCYCSDARREIVVAVERIEYEDPRQETATEIEKAENSLKSALRFLSDAKKQLR